MTTRERNIRRLTAALCEAFYGGQASALGLGVAPIFEGMRTGAWLDGYYVEGIDAPGELTWREVRALRKAAKHILSILEEP